jgi:ABC-type xylose transport system permease subunit
MPNIQNVLLRAFNRNLRSNILIMALVAIWVGFGIATPSFWSGDNVQNVLPQMAIIAIMACGMVFVIVTGGIDLSVGYGAGFVSVVGAAILYFGVIDEPLQALFPSMSAGAVEVVTMAVTVLLCMALGLLMGVFQGYIIARLAVPPFIVTLGGLYIFKSGILLVTQGKSLFISSNDTFKLVAQGLLPPLAGYVLAALVAAALFTRVVQARPRKRRYGIEPGAAPPAQRKAGVLTRQVVG